MIILGIDPGMSGGAAVLPVDSSWQLKAEPSAVKFSDLTERDIADLFWKIYADAQSAGDEVFGVLELVQAMPAIRRVKGPNGEERQEVNAGIVSTAKFMQGYGYLRGCLITIGIQLEDVRPQAWQKLLGCMTRGNKNISKAKAQQLFPQLRITHATADCLLIAEYGRRIRMGLKAGSLFTKQEEQPTERAVG